MSGPDRNRVAQTPYRRLARQSEAKLCGNERIPVADLTLRMKVGVEKL
jgi:hypothetical protein